MGDDTSKQYSSADISKLIQDINSVVSAQNIRSDYPDNYPYHPLLKDNGDPIIVEVDDKNYVAWLKLGGGEENASPEVLLLDKNQASAIYSTRPDALAGVKYDFDPEHFLRYEINKGVRILDSVYGGHNEPEFIIPSDVVSKTSSISFGNELNPKSGIDYFKPVEVSIDVDSPSGFKGNLASMAANTPSSIISKNPADAMVIGRMMRGFDIALKKDPDASELTTQQYVTSLTDSYPDHADVVAAYALAKMSNPKESFGSYSKEITQRSLGGDPKSVLAGTAVQQVATPIFNAATRAITPQVDNGEFNIDKVSVRLDEIAKMPEGPARADMLNNLAQGVLNHVSGALSVNPSDFMARQSGTVLGMQFRDNGFAEQAVVIMQYSMGQTSVADSETKLNLIHQKSYEPVAVQSDRRVTTPRNFIPASEIPTDLGTINPRFGNITPDEAIKSVLGRFNISSGDFDNVYNDVLDQAIKRGDIDPDNIPDGFKQQAFETVMKAMDGASGGAEILMREGIEAKMQSLPGELERGLQDGFKSQFEDDRHNGLNRFEKSCEMGKGIPEVDAACAKIFAP